MSIRVGVDVGGTFTKAIAFDMEQGAVVADAIVPTTHGHAGGVATGVVDVVEQLAVAVGPERIDLVTHSTTQAVNALLEGDVARVGMIGMGRSPDLRKARKRTIGPRIELSEGKTLETESVFLDVTNGLSADAAREAVAQLHAAGAEAIAVAEAFAPDDVTNEGMISAAAEQLDLPVTTSAELTGLYGLELRAVTAALNASILPIALRTAEIVGTGVAAAGIKSPVMVMRGDGGATDLSGFRRAPARTLYSGPAASVAGALRSSHIDDAVIVEVGGTSSNVAAIRRGRPALSYVQVASHVTAIRALDVRVIGVAGGSMLRSRRRRVYGVGPRSAHIAGLPYACFGAPADFDGATTELITPRPGDPAEYLVVRRANGERVALTNTCAANALGLVEPADYAYGDPDAARAAFRVAGETLNLPGDEVARRMLQASVQAIGELVEAVIREHHLESPALVAVGGGAGALGRAIASAMRLDIVVPEHAEVISAIGDALSLIRAERERTFDTPTPADTQALIAEMEAEAIRAGASATSLDVRVEQIVERGAVRVTVTGAVGLNSGAMPGREAATAAEVTSTATARGYDGVTSLGQYWLATRADRIAVFDYYGDLVVEVHGEMHAVTDGATDEIATALDRRTKRVGPMTIAPDVWVIGGTRFVQVVDTSPDGIVESAAALAEPGAPATVIIGRE